jgi:4-carboxymuconolactone decarboxylase
MPRIPLFPLDNMTDAQRLAYDKASGGPNGPIRGPTRAVLHNAELADKWRAMGDLLRNGTSLPLRLSELAILATARRWTAQFVFHTHVAPALKGGLADAVVEAIRDNRTPVFDKDDEAAVYEYSAALAELGTVSEAQHRRVHALLGTAGVVELTAIVGYYSMVAMTVNAHDVLPETALPLAPRGKA